MSEVVHTNTRTEYSFWEYVKDLVGFVKPYKTKFGLATLLRLSSDIANLYPAWALSQIVLLLTSISAHPENTERITFLIVTWVIAVIYFMVSHSVAKYFAYQVSTRVTLDSRMQALRHIFSLDIAWQEKENTGNKLKRIDSGTQGIDRVLRIFIDVIIEASLNSVGMLVIFLVLGWELGLSLLLFMVSYFALSFFMTKKATSQEYVVSEIEEEYEGLTFESLNNIKTVKSLGIHQAIIRNLDVFTERTFIAIKRRIMLHRLRYGAIGLYYLLFQLAMIAYIVYGIVRGQYQLDMLILFIGYMYKVEEAISELADVTHEIVLTKVNLHRLKDILNVKPTIEDNRARTPMPTNWQQIVFKDVSFSYEEKPVLINFNVTIKRGEKIGIVGLSGAGKSTLFSLLLDLYENYEGDILIDDVPLKDIDRQEYINHVAVVLQETELFNSSLKENILIGSGVGQEYNEVALREALTSSYLDEVISRLPKGMDTVIGEKGVKLSGGEKQRLGIARALYRAPDLLLMDEATSHLDVESEKKIQASLHAFFSKVTAVVIAHRLSTIREMDRIIVLQKGEIVEQGSFSKLISKGGVFAELWEKQKL